jgi:adenine-specific DNA-methyltransferase
LVGNKVTDIKDKINLDLSNVSDLQEYIFLAVKQLILKFLKDTKNIEEVIELLLKDLTFLIFNNEKTEEFDFSWTMENSFHDIVEQDLLGELYSNLLPKDWKKTSGFFLTPFNITDWMIIESNFLNSFELPLKTTMDPCSGTGRFFLSLINLLYKSNKLKLLDLSKLVGFDKDPFSVFISRVNLSFQFILLMKISVYSEQVQMISKVVDAITCLDFLNPSAMKISRFISSEDQEISKLDKIFNKIAPFNNGIDYVFCNPPYNKIQLTVKQQKLFRKSIYGHVNAYAIFLHLSINLASNNGILIFIMPESFRSGLYFKNLRKFLISNTSLNKIVLINNRTGIFNNVLQGLGIFQFQKTREDKIATKVKIYNMNSSHDLFSQQINSFSVQQNKIIYLHDREPYFVFGENEKSYQIFEKVQSKSIPFQDFIGSLEVTTGHIVWNRLKELLKDENSVPLTKDDYPLIWSDNYDSFTFNFKGKSNRKRYITMTNKISNFLMKKPVILVKRVTAKEQTQRIVATLIPDSLSNFFVENHSNIISSGSWNFIDQLCILGYMNSSIANYLFTLLNGNTQVSATELRVLPFPKMTDEQKKKLSSLVKKIIQNFIEPTKKKIVIAELNSFFYQIFDLTETLQKEISRKLTKEK